jgi:hypothetical protein
LAFDPDSRTLYGFTERHPRRLITIDWTTAQSTVVGVTHEPGELGDFVQDGIATIPEPLLVATDIKPGSCPNPFNLRSRGVLPVAIVGARDFDVDTVDPLSVRLNGVRPLRSSIEDVAAPFHPYDGKASCELDCDASSPDGVLDLTLKFSRREIRDTLGEAANGDCVVLELTGQQKPERGGRAIAGEDVVLIIGES